MINNNLEFLKQVAKHELTPEQAIGKLQVEDAELAYAKVDLARQARTGYPEVIYGENKTAKQVIAIIKRLQAEQQPVLATRIGATKAEQVQAAIPVLHYHEQARLLSLSVDKGSAIGEIAIVTAGTSDLNVAEEAAVTAEFFGNQVTRIYDVGVAGIHRLFKQLPAIRRANVVIVIAGMEGALVSVVGGLISQPIIAVPTSVGYGSHLNGLTPLLAMLNSCAAGVSVVNIDNGFGAGYNASMINHLAQGANQ
ncbi:nickel pincer cofactor biosynthesis protein LarB [Latilactobacillus graminis]|uniref:Phosphoribosylaminoimidazole carboxylase catalytic subunit n=2 Tax=Latilactobacillus graminis TaxID=60519 RepID=A0AA89I173_9LACO|nr:nickel pincer cofactor biosynthesis protein LarB [Latilactobacillus graminis]KRM23627.1 phosphoribosylaminoimidazole carboxylase catalytic subunit [Latilactobacillus graminis DSM 20719]QFP80180.1 nickel pincer cofactor biosynthesis protein LarB [Latilactobacillus graminis]